jgi:hypothetical protein
MAYTACRAVIISYVYRRYVSFRRKSIQGVGRDWPAWHEWRSSREGGVAWEALRSTFGTAKVDVSSVSMCAIPFHMVFRSFVWRHGWRRYAAECILLHFQLSHQHPICSQSGQSESTCLKMTLNTFVDMVRQEIWKGEYLQSFSAPYIKDWHFAAEYPRYEVWCSQPRVAHVKERFVSQVMGSQLPS